MSQDLKGEQEFTRENVWRAWDPSNQAEGPARTEAAGVTCRHLTKGGMRGHLGRRGVGPIMHTQPCHLW